MVKETYDNRVNSYRPLLSPTILKEEIPIPTQCSELVDKSRQDCENIILGKDPRLLVITGPCSIHDCNAAIDYAHKLSELQKTLDDNLVIVMRVYFEKPRTTIGWKGLINDPHLNNTFDINNGLRTARKLLVDISEIGLPCGTEFLDVITPQFIADLITWGAIGARTTESQIHREMASGLSMPIGFKNGTDGNVQVAIDALKAVGHPHQFLGVTEQSLAAIISTKGNKTCHVILRGSSTGTNYDKKNVLETYKRLEKSNLNARLMIDCSHGNSSKNHLNQPKVVGEISSQLEQNNHICGVMLESFLEEGNQSLTTKKSLKYGQSITDACMAWETTTPVLYQLADAVDKRRNASST
tara:strand:+ start:148 stop:1212 length:1065 start_codon:yes stop_codon:yes gene_type:complete